MQNPRATLPAGQLEHCIEILDARYPMLPLIGVCKAAIRPGRQSAEGDDLQA